MPQRKPNLCPSINGALRRADGARTVQLTQDGLTISCVDDDPSYEHQGSGQWNGTFFDYRVFRKNIVTGCVTQMFGEIDASVPGQFVLRIVGSDARCDLSATFAETTQWQKA